MQNSRGEKIRGYTAYTFVSLHYIPDEDIIRCCAHERWCIGNETGGNTEPCFSVIADYCCFED